MLSIGIFTYSTRPRGSVVHATQLAEALTRRGHDVTLYALSKAGDALYREVACKLVLLRAEAAPADPDQLIQQRIREIASGLAALAPHHDVYHAEDCLVASGLLSAAAEAELELRPLVRTLHHLEHFQSPYLQACQRRSILEADAVASVSRVSQRDLERELRVRSPIIGNGVDLARFEQRSLEAEAALRQRLGIELGAPVVLSVGGVEPRKNSLNSLAAMATLLEREPRLRWLIAGGASIWEHDRYRNDFEARLTALPAAVRSRVVQLGPVSEAELTTLYAISSVLLCASLQEGFGLCVLEALASRLPVVVSEGEPFCEYLDDGCASFVEPRSSAGIALAIEQLLKNEALRAARAEAGHGRARQFSWDVVASEHERLYGKLARSVNFQRAKAHEESIHA